MRFFRLLPEFQLFGPPEIAIFLDTPARLSPRRDAERDGIQTPQFLEFGTTGDGKYDILSLAFLIMERASPVQ